MASSKYVAAARALRQPIDRPVPDRMVELIRAATLAANGHNTQPWKFEIADNRVSIRPDFSRRTPVVDPDDHHLYASLGCAAENLVLAANAHGLAAEVTGSKEGVDVVLGSDSIQASPLVRQIPLRQCTRLDYDGRKLANGDLDRLAEAGRRETVDCRIVQSESDVSGLCDLVLEGNNAQLEDQAFVSELRDWIRFNGRHALERRDGLYSGAMGSPALPAWLGRRILPFVLRPKTENDRYARQIRSSAALAIFCAQEDAPSGWIEAGRAYQRFALTATEMGLKHAFLNQPVEVARLRPQLAQLAGLSGRRPNLVVRFGSGPAAVPSLRRPVEAVIERRLQ